MMDQVKRKFILTQHSLWLNYANSHINHLGELEGQDTVKSHSCPKFSKVFYGTSDSARKVERKQQK